MDEDLNLRKKNYWAATCDGMSITSSPLRCTNNPLTPAASFSFDFGSIRTVLDSPDAATSWAAANSKLFSYQRSYFFSSLAFIPSLFPLPSPHTQWIYRTSCGFQTLSSSRASILFSILFLFSSLTLKFSFSFICSLDKHWLDSSLCQALC